jgi:molybdate transport system substrate-binding protein
VQRSLLLALASVAAAVALGGCGNGGGDERVVVSAAASLKPAFERYGETLEERPAFSFGGSDELAAQIRAGVEPDVYAAANLTLPEALHREGLVERPRPFASNRIVIATPGGQEEIRSIADLARPRVTLAIGSASVPVGAYTRKLLGRLAPATARRILANVRSSEPDVAGIVGKLTQGAVDAGFVYATDVKASSGRMRAIELPERLRPRVAYGVAAVVGAPHPEAARRFVEGLLGDDGRQALLNAGFQRPP